MFSEGSEIDPSFNSEIVQDSAYQPRNESFEHQEKSPHEIRRALLDKFQDNLSIVRPALIDSRSKEGESRKRPLITVVVSLWEEDGFMLASKMFQESMNNLRRQAESSDLDLDFIVVANNGGGKTARIGESMKLGVSNTLRTTFDEPNYREVITNKPIDAVDQSIPWDTEIPLSNARIEGKDRCYFVVQPQDDLNVGKVRALRDVSHTLRAEILKGYAPDAVFQMDAETILEYKPTHHSFTKPPIRALYDTLKRRDGVVAIGTKDRFEPMDPETGKPLGKVMPFPQEGMTQINRGARERFISLPGGALLAEPDYYVAGMNAITEVTFGNVAEDYMFTQMLREYTRSNGLQDMVRLNSVDVITHLNRCPQGKAAVEQLLRWKKQGNAVDQIFPEVKYEYKPLTEYTLLVVKSRLRRLRSIDEKRNFIKQILRDVTMLPGMLKIARENGISDLILGNSSWEHNNR